MGLGLGLLLLVVEFVDDLVLETGQLGVELVLEIDVVLVLRPAPRPLLLLLNQPQTPVHLPLVVVLPRLEIPLPPLQLPHHLAVFLIKEVLLTTLLQVLYQGEVAVLASSCSLRPALGRLSDEGTPEVAFVVERDEGLAVGLGKRGRRLEQAMQHSYSSNIFFYPLYKSHVV